jgi:hypothetical protein
MNAIAPRRNGRTGSSPQRLLKCLVRPVALGFLDEQSARAVIALALANAEPDHPDPAWRIRFAGWLLRQRADAYAVARGLEERRVRQAVWPLCEQRRPGSAILAAAERAAGPLLREHELLDLCRHVARQAGRRHGQA